MSNTSSGDELVLTPGGWRPRSKVHRLEPGQHVSAKDSRLRIIETSTGRVVRDMGETKAAGKTPNDPLKPPGPIISGGTGSGHGGVLAPHFPDDGWIEDAATETDLAQPISYFSATWMIPPPPATYDGQGVALFNGLQVADPVGTITPIIQPVLFWGEIWDMGGGQTWSLVNAYGDASGNFIYGLHPLSPLTYQPGTTVTGVISLTQVAEAYSYVCSFAQYPSLDLQVYDLADAFDQAVVTLECYQMTQCSDYPNTDMTQFYDIELKVGTAPATYPQSLPLEAETLFDTCGQRCEVASYVNPGGVVNIYYRNAPIIPPFDDVIIGPPFEDFQDVHIFFDFSDFSDFHDFTDFSDFHDFTDFSDFHDFTDFSDFHDFTDFDDFHDFTDFDDFPDFDDSFTDSGDFDDG
jgi:hypothetical protein